MGDNKPEMIKVCLKVFVTKGLKDTTSCDLSKAIYLLNGGLYHSSLLITKRSSPVLRRRPKKLEEEFLYTTIKELNDPDKAIANLYERADKMAPYTSFIRDNRIMKKDDNATGCIEKKC